MILADKIIQLRKKNGWSQEDLADKMNVSRQAVSKWESAQTVPDLSKILQLSDLFGVTTDYLLKDEIEEEEPNKQPSDPAIKKITAESAVAYMEQRKRASRKIAAATFLCIISPIPLLLLAAATEIPGLGVSETVMGAVGLSALFVCVLIAVPIYIFVGFQNEPYEFLDKKVPFETERGVKELVTAHKKQFRSSYVTGNLLAACLCVGSPVPLIVSSFFENEMLGVIMLSVMLVTVGIGAAIFIRVGVQNAAMQKLLKEGDYTESEKAKSSFRETIGTAYWGGITAVWLLWSFLTNQWHITWVVFAVGGVLFPVVLCLCNLATDRRNRKQSFRTKSKKQGLTQPSVLVFRCLKRKGLRNNFRVLPVG